MYRKKKTIENSISIIQIKVISTQLLILYCKKKQFKLNVHECGEIIIAQQYLVSTHILPNFFRHGAFKLLISILFFFLKHNLNVVNDIRNNAGIFVVS